MLRRAGKTPERQSRIEDVSDEHRAVQPLHHPAQDCRLSGPYFTRHHDQAFTTLDAVVEIGHHFRVQRGRIKRGSGVSANGNSFNP